MTIKMKFGRSIWFYGRRLLVSLLAGALFLSVLGIILAVAVSVAGRYRTPEAVLAEHYPPHWTEPHWYNNPESQLQVSDFEVIYRQALDELNAIHFVYRWQRDYNGRISYCEGGALAQEFQDVFSGWQELGRAMSGCGSRYSGSSLLTSFWESMPWEFPHYYYFYAFGREPVAARVEVVLGDGSSESVATVDSRYALVVQREAPFKVEQFKYTADSGTVLRIKRH